MGTNLDPWNCLFAYEFRGNRRKYFIDQDRFRHQYPADCFISVFWNNGTIIHDAPSLRNRANPWVNGDHRINLIWDFHSPQKGEHLTIRCC